MKTLDEVRAKYPHLGMTLYAIEPGKPVTLELITPDGKLYEFRGATEEAAIAAFVDESGGEEPPPEPAPAPAPVTSVFD
jgi:hypothetical protein